MSKQKNWKVRSHSEPIADTGDYDGYWEIVNDKGDSFRTSEDYDDIEKDLQKIADLLNSFDGALSLETACEINLHCDNMQLKMEIDQLKQPKDSPYQGSAGDQWQDEHLAEVTEIMRDADMRFAGIGGGTRHYLRDLLFPMLQEKGLSICRAAVPAGDGEAIEILKELCRLKSHKDNVGKDSVYEQQQPEAWKRANEFLNRLITPPTKSV